ncbi:MULTISPECIES: CBS domain-containing protein [unclassified Streptomyces]|uniref:CBS domain-containing protein n=1 Tax=unclassified Streptomyces TaxID=2593676 RepID=UPI001587DB62|nr:MULTISPECIES: CBS domain-containing protein [unclassified Streptomyces]NUV68749.1 CBS domain-containing protein [Streptomyces sp. CAI-121]NUV98742.1 CBS domain-containing protein [Streptomyces sp. CAI 127]NUW14891.1 CBS domain-containing protein [Streptomyces sp. CAI-68]
MRQLRVGELMTADVVTVGASTPSADVAGLFTRHAINGVPVVDEDGHVLGVVSASDLRGRRAPTAAGVMSAPAVTVEAEQTASEAARLMVRRGHERLPVIDDEERLVGMVTRRDLLGLFVRPDAEVKLRIREDVLDGVLRVRADTVQVHVLDGVVVLAGRLPRPAQLRTALALTSRTEGVIAVVNRIAVETDDDRQETREP